MPPSPLYTTLHATATEFALSSSPDLPNTNTFSPARALAIRTPSCTTSWGPASFAASARLTTPLDNAGFFKHMEGMIPNLETWKVEVRDVVVDEERGKSVVRCWYDMTVKGNDTGGKEERTVRNDVVWFLEMEEGGRRVREAVEYVDAGASGRIGGLIGKFKEGG